MNEKTENQHYVSQVLLRRFKVLGNPLQCYRVETGEWKQRNPSTICSTRGWNDLLAFGQNDNSLEAAFSKVESYLPETFRLLEEAVNRDSTEFPRAAYQHLCQYCTFLYLTSPFAKAKAVPNFLIQLNFELENGTVHSLRELSFSEDTIARFRRAHTLGGKLIMNSGDCVQLVYRIQFRKSYPHDYAMFLRWTEWTICRSPIELPVSDVALVPVYRMDHKANYYLLPIAPRLLLKGRIYMGPQTAFLPHRVKRENLSRAEAEYWMDIICLSAIKELVCSRVIPNVSMNRSRARANGTAFTKIVNPDLVVSAGLKEFDTDFGFRVVSTSEYVKFIHSFIQPTFSIAASAA